MIVAEALNPGSFRQLPLADEILNFLLQLADRGYVVKMHEIHGLRQRRDVAVRIDESRKQRMPRQIPFFQFFLRMSRLPGPRLC